MKVESRIHLQHFLGTVDFREEDEEEEEDMDEGKDDYDANAQWEDAFEQEAF